MKNILKIISSIFFLIGFAGLATAAPNNSSKYELAVKNNLSDFHHPDATFYNQEKNILALYNHSRKNDQIYNFQKATIIAKPDITKMNVVNSPLFNKNFNSTDLIWVGLGLIGLAGLARKFNKKNTSY